MKILALFLSACWGWAVQAQEWRDALDKMPISDKSIRLYKMAPVKTFLASFRSNQIVKGLVFLPAATDQLYFFDQGEIRGAATLKEALIKMSEKSSLKHAFHAPFVLIYASGDQTNSPALPAARGLEDAALAHVEFIDKPWETLVPMLEPKLRFKMLPTVNSPEAWHFYRACFGGWNLNRGELLRALAWSTKTAIASTSPDVLEFRLRP